MVVNQLKRLLGKIIRFGMILPDNRKHHTYSHRVVLQLSVPHTASPTFIRLIGSIATVGMLATSTLCLPVGITNKLKLLAYHGRYVCSYALNKYASGASPGAITTLQSTENVVLYVLFIPPAGARHQMSIRSWFQSGLI